MSTYHLSHELGFLHWEAHPSVSRQRLKIGAPCEAGDVLIRRGENYVPFGTPEPEESGHYQPNQPLGGEVDMGIALEAGKAGASVACVVRLASVVVGALHNLSAQQLSAVEQDALRAAASAQHLVFVHEPKGLADTRKGGLSA